MLGAGAPMLKPQPCHPPELPHICGHARKAVGETAAGDPHVVAADCSPCAAELRPKLCARPSNTEPDRKTGKTLDDCFDPGSSASSSGGVVRAMNSVQQFAGRNDRE